MKIFLDDERPTPTDWVRAYSVNEAIDFINALREIGTEIEEMSLDHDLGEYYEDGGDGIKLLDWMAEFDIWPTKGITVHSGNTVGIKDMMRLIDRYSPFRVDARYNKRGDVS